jgi:hypothetical protein
MATADQNTGEPDVGSQDAANGAPPRRRLSWLVLAAGIVGLALAGIAIGIVWGRRHHKPPESLLAGPLEDPRLTYNGPYQNIHPDVKYVGDAACVGCHDKKAKGFQRHPMGRSIVPISELAATQPLDAKHNNPFVHDGITLDVVRRGEHVWHRRRRLDSTGKPIYEVEQEVHYAIGSGARGYSYLSRTPDGFLVQTPISWYSQTQTWRLSPGMENTGVLERPVHQQCLFCHANRTRFRQDSINHYDEPIFDGLAIGCERCHGPGSVHVEFRNQERSAGKRSAGIDYTIVNPKRLRPGLREAVCQQCHLEGHPRILHRGRRLDEFRPGLAIEEFWSVFAEMSEETGEPKAVSQVEQMYQSRCFQGGTHERRLSCTSCHDPHEYPERVERISYYNGRCMECHQQRRCTESRTERDKKDDSCIACHMPPRGSLDIPHTAFTDHRIPRRPGQPSKPDRAKTRKYLGASGSGLVLRPFNPGGMAIDREESARDCGVALHHLARTGAAGSDPSLFATFGLALLDAALKRDPEDGEARAARADFRLFTRRDLEGALADIEIVLATHPEHELLLAKAAWLTDQLGQENRASGYLRRLVAANPWLASYRQRLAVFLTERAEWEEAWPHCQAWQRLDPESVPARSLVVGYLIRAGKKAEARAEFEKIVALRPANLDELKTWFAKEMR